MVSGDPGWQERRKILRKGTMDVCCINVRKRGAKDDLETDSYDLYERAAVPRFQKRDRKIWKAGRKLVGSFELLARSPSFIPPPS